MKIVVLVVVLLVVGGSNQAWGQVGFSLFGPNGGGISAIFPPSYGGYGGYGGGYGGGVQLGINLPLGGGYNNGYGGYGNFGQGYSQWQGAPPCRSNGGYGGYGGYSTFIMPPSNYYGGGYATPQFHQHQHQHYHPRY